MRKILTVVIGIIVCALAYILLVTHSPFDKKTSAEPLERTEPASEPGAALAPPSVALDQEVRKTLSQPSASKADADCNDAATPVGGCSDAAPLPTPAMSSSSKPTDDPLGMPKKP
jgi:hypothetical protein